MAMAIIKGSSMLSVMQHCLHRQFGWEDLYYSSCK